MSGPKVMTAQTAAGRDISEERWGEPLLRQFIRVYRDEQKLCSEYSTWPSSNRIRKSDDPFMDPTSKSPSERGSKFWI